ncbi:TetR/AcrR family transcriptional regulator, partial [Specibacter sp. RAF43]|uniref:TetR/AcrR family transcriptional regulator n=1 Tax=Specibacter sp. RAF43 TaxID=3233057 RepID=UPI003F96478C
LEIDFNAVAEAAAAVFAENGYEGVSIDAVAEKLDISRATLYRTVPTKSHLMGILFERATEELNLSATALVAQDRDPESTLLALIRLQIGTAVQLRQYMNVFFGGAGLSPEMYARWRAWTRDYERVWIGVVGRAMDAGVIPVDDPV